MIGAAGTTRVTSSPGIERLLFGEGRDDCRRLFGASRAAPIGVMGTWCGATSGESSADLWEFADSPRFFLREEPGRSERGLSSRGSSEAMQTDLSAAACAADACSARSTPESFFCLRQMVISF